LFRSINSVTYPFTFSTSVAAGKPPDGDGPFYHNKVIDLVKSVISKLEESVDIRGRNLTTDRYYTSYELAEYLLEHKITLVGTLQKNRRGIPAEVKSTHGREHFSYEVYWSRTNDNISMHSYVVKPKSSTMKNVLLLASMPPLLGRTTDDGQLKPAIYKFYDFTKDKLTCALGCSISN